MEELVKQGAMKCIWLEELSSNEFFVLVSSLCRVMIFLFASSSLYPNMVTKVGRVHCIVMSPGADGTTVLLHSTDIGTR